MLKAAEQVCHLGIRTDEVQKARIVAAAGRDGISVSEWCRRALEGALDAENVSLSEPQVAPERPVERPAQIRTFMDAVRQAREREIGPR